MNTMDLYSFPTQPANFDRLGTFYITFCAVWTTLVFAGMGFLFVNRQSPVMKVRGIALSFAAILMLHAYWVLAQVVYPVGLTIPIVLAYDIQYFFMGIWFPLGIALFHAFNSRFLRVARLQKQFAHPDLRGPRPGCNGARTSWLCRFRNIDYSKRILVYIGIGMVVQVLLTVGMWLACRKYHPTFGVPGTELRGSSLQEQIVELGRGWEWWPSVLWQVIWTWIVAPLLIWRAWGIRDTLGWRFQTIGCCLSNLHATPMFLIAQYVPAFGPINQYFAPSEWIHLSVMMFDIFTIFVPCWLVIKHQIQQKRAADSNARWDTASPTTASSRGQVSWIDGNPGSSAEKGHSVELLDEELGDRLLTLGALDHVLSSNPKPLQEFSALKDFSGENVAFLTRAATWRAAWPRNPDEAQIRDAFTHALAIYTDLVSPRDAEFPINLSSPDLKRLETIFERPARIVCGEVRVDPATPFECDVSTTSSQEQLHPGGGAGGGGGRINLGEMAGRIRFTGEIPEGFGPYVFDAAETHVKYLVLTNTWPKFVAETQRLRRRSMDSERTDYTSSNASSLMGKVLTLVRSLT